MPTETGQKLTATVSLTQAEDVLSQEIEFVILATLACEQGSIKYIFYVCCILNIFCIDLVSTSAEADGCIDSASTITVQKGTFFNSTEFFSEFLFI